MNPRASLRAIIRYTGRLNGAILETVETAPWSLGTFTVSFSALITVRILIESGIRGFQTEGFAFHFFEFSHTFLFFLFAFIVFLPVARIAGAASFTRAANLILFGFLVIWTPPIIDKAIFGDQIFWSFYELDGIPGLAYRFFHFFGDTPNIGMTYGARIEVALMTLGLTAYSFFRRRDAFRSLWVALLAYLVFFVLGTFPSYVAIAALAPEHGLLGVTELDVVAFTLTPGSYLGRPMADPRMSLGIRMSIVYALVVSLSIGILLRSASRPLFLALLRNVRWPQILWHGGLFLLGTGLASIYAGADLRLGFFEWLGIATLLVAVVCAWLASVVVNDIADRPIDEMTNPGRPLPTASVTLGGYRVIGILFFAASILFAGIVSMKVMLLLLAYQAVAFLYSSPPFRFKRVPLVATALSAIAGLLVLIAGYSTVAPTADISPLPPELLLFLFTAYMVTIPLKDFKDIEGDRKDGVYTIPVLLGVKRAQIAIGTALFLCYAASPIILRDPSLSLFALLFGSGAFLSTVTAKNIPHGRDSLRALPAIQMTLVMAYGLIVAILLLR